MKTNSKKIWIDLDNSPHVVFFYPIIRKLEKLGYEISLTARECFQTCGLADMYHLEYTKVGKHYGKNKLLKLLGTLYRAMQLLSIVKKDRPVLAISHGSRAQTLACWLLKVPDIVIFDYEYAKGLGYIDSTWKMAPAVVVKNSEYSGNNLLAYPGIKEDVYVSEFVPDSDVIAQLGFNVSDFVVTIRPPATEAHYHNPESEILFDEVVNTLGQHPDVRMVILPRNEQKQTEYIKRTWPEWCGKGKIIIPDHVVNGLDLIWYSDFVVSGGGTMNREAAALGVPVYSIFRGKIGAVDKYLSEQGRLVLLESTKDIHTKMHIERRKKDGSLPQTNRAALDTIVKHIIEVLEEETNRR